LSTLKEFIQAAQMMFIWWIFNTYGYL